LSLRVDFGNLFNSMTDLVSAPGDLVDGVLVGELLIFLVAQLKVPALVPSTGSHFLNQQWRAIVGNAVFQIIGGACPLFESLLGIMRGEGRQG